MSFYGSVYYQLIDTFYKIIVKNSGDKTYTFNDVPFNPSGTPENEIIESPAVGRKGVFSLTNGNYWINFSKSDDVDEAAPYKIWHNPAHDDPETSKRISSWDIESDQYTYEKDDKGIETAVYNKDGVPMVAGEDYIQLQDHEFIRMYPSHYDEAGHIIDTQTEPTLYRLPKSDVNEQVNWLLGLIGEPSEDKQLPMWEIPEEERTEGLAQSKDNSVMTLTDYAEKNYEDLRTQESYVGDWSTIAQYWGEDWYMSPSITDFIGKVEDMFNDPSVEANNYEEFKNWFLQGWNLVKILGELPKMWRAMDVSGSNIPISFSDAIVKLAKNLSDYKNEVSGRLAVINAAIEGHTLRLDDIDETIGEDTRNLGSVYPALNSLQDEIVAEATARRNADDKLTNNLAKEVSDREAAVAELNKALTKEIQDRTDADTTISTALEQEVTDRTNAVSELSTNVYAKIAEEKKALQDEIDSDNEAQTNAITAAYQQADTNLDTKLSQALSDAQKNINERISTLEQLHDKHYDELTEDIQDINNTLGAQPNEVTVFARLATADSEIQGLKDSLGTTGDVSVATELTNIKNSIGTTADVAGTNTVYGTIASTNANVDTNTQSIENIKSSYLTQTVASETYLNRSDAASTYLTQVNAASTYLSKEEAANTYLVEDNITQLRQDVSNIQTTLGDIASIIIDGTSGQDVTTILNQILIKIEEINTKIDELHQETNVESTDPEVTDPEATE